MIATKNQYFFFPKNVNNCFIFSVKNPYFPEKSLNLFGNLSQEKKARLIVCNSHVAFISNPYIPVAPIITPPLKCQNVIKT